MYASCTAKGALTKRRGRAPKIKF